LFKRLSAYTAIHCASSRGSSCLCSEVLQTAYHLKATIRKVGEVGMMDIVQLTVFDVALIFFNIALILIRLHFLEKRVKKLERR